MKPGIEYKFDNNTMPVVLYREDLNQLHLGPADGATSGTTPSEWAPEQQAMRRRCRP